MADTLADKKHARNKEELVLRYGGSIPRNEIETIYDRCRLALGEEANVGTWVPVLVREKAIEILSSKMCKRYPLELPQQ